MSDIPVDVRSRVEIERMIQENRKLPTPRSVWSHDCNARYSVKRTACEAILQY